MGKVLNTNYHTQINNKVLPYVTCGTTCLASMLDWLNMQSGKEYPCDDDKVLEILNSAPIIEIAQSMIKSGALDSSALDYRADNPNTPNVDEAKYTHLNNFKEMLVTVGNFITKDSFIFQKNQLSFGDIKKSLDNNFPVTISGKFTAGGHFILLVGYDDEGNFIVDDPYGDWNSGYSQETIGKGAKLKYKADSINQAVTFKAPVNGIMCYQIVSCRQGIIPG